MSVLRFTNAPLALTGVVHDLSITLDFDGPQPSHFGAAPARAQPMTADGFIGDTRQGGSCNAMRVELNPHCNGTHTECVGHLTTSRVSIHDVCPALPLLAALISTETSPCEYDGVPTSVITSDALRPALDSVRRQADDAAAAQPTALVVRSRPNPPSKRHAQYTSMADSPFFDPAAVADLVELGFDHLLVDIPSIDPFSDGGRLAAHRVLFGLPTFDQCPSPALENARRAHATLTEMIYVDDQIRDGLYLLNLQIPAFSLDAAPSRPLLYALESL
ncbi:MAG: cyclase family protein [Pseudomonadota bacterium]